MIGVNKEKTCTGKYLYREKLVQGNTIPKPFTRDYCDSKRNILFLKLFKKS